MVIEDARCSPCRRLPAADRPTSLRAPAGRRSGRNQAGPPVARACRAPRDERVGTKRGPIALECGVAVSSEPELRALAVEDRWEVDRAADERAVVPDVVHPVHAHWPAGFLVGLDERFAIHGAYLYPG